MNKNRLLTRRVAEVIDEKHLSNLLRSGKKLRIKLGIDPNKPVLHLGHAVTLLKLREFQEHGHTAVLIIGDWTAQIGDPSGQEESRARLSYEEVKRNIDYFFDQVGTILDKDKDRLEIKCQSEWYKEFRLDDIFELTSKTTVSQLMAHETFRERLASDKKFLTYEILYPLLQAYDSVAVRADVELGATEQKFNLLMGRQIQQSYGQKPQDVVMVPYLIGLDGKEKMSKTLDNYVALTDLPEEKYGKIMSLPDKLIEHYFELCTDLDEKEIKQIRKEHPKERKARLAREIVSIYHSQKKAEAAEREFEKKYGGKITKKLRLSIKADFTLKKKAGTYPLVDVLTEGGLASSKSEARRKIREGAVEINNKKITDEKKEIKIKPGDLLRLGKRFLRIK